MSVSPPTLPKNISIISITRDIADRPLVMPSDSPTVPIAELVSNRQVSSGRFSTLLIMTPLVKNNTRYINKTAPALRTVSSDILLLKHCTSFLRLNTVIAESNRTAKVVVFIPPAVEPGEPPISIRMTIMAVPDSSIAARSVVLKPAVRVVTD